MTAPLPQDAPGYNTTPRPRPKKWFRTPDRLDGFYSPFWPLLIVFFAFMLLLVYEISFLRHRAMGLYAQNARLVEALQKVKGQASFIQGLHDDLQALAPTHPGPALLLKEFFPPTAPAPAEPVDPTKIPPVDAAPADAKAPAAGNGLPPATAPPHP